MKRFLVLGCGYTGLAAARLARDRGMEVMTHVRSEARAAALRAEGFEVGFDPSWITRETHVLVAFPPDGTTDARIAPLCGGAGAVTYISSTGVYGDHRGIVDDTTPVRAGADRVAAETLYREAGRAIVLRCPGIYGPERGLHVRVTQGKHQIPGDGTHHLSRIHVEDLAMMILASATVPGPDTFVVGDLSPAPHLEVVRFICETHGVPLPPFVPLASVHESLRGDRQIDPRRALAALGVTLRYPTYREGMGGRVPPA